MARENIFTGTKTFNKELFQTLLIKNGKKEVTNMLGNQSYLGRQQDT